MLLHKRYAVGRECIALRPPSEVLWVIVGVFQAAAEELLAGILD
jgi:hypothetical protein